MTPDVSSEVIPFQNTGGLRLIWQWLRTEMGCNTPVEESTKAPLRRIMDFCAKESGKFLDIRVEGWGKPVLVTCRI